MCPARSGRPASGTAKALSEAAKVPVYLAATDGVFRTRDVLAVYSHS
jgi:hypothetical protein